MINAVYLVLVMYSGNTSGRSMTTVQIPQANMAQCLSNQKNYSKDSLVIRTYCIVGVK